MTGCEQCAHWPQSGLLHSGPDGPCALLRADDKGLCGPDPEHRRAWAFSRQSPVADAGTRNPARVIFPVPIPRLLFLQRYVTLFVSVYRFFLFSSGGSEDAFTRNVGSRAGTENTLPQHLPMKGKL